jgi:hypothetical protein
MADEDVNSKQFFGKSWLGRILRGEEQIEFASTEPIEWPKFRETAYVDEHGKISVSRSWYGPDGGDKAIGDSVLQEKDSTEYKEVMGRHPDLAPDKPSTYREFHDGRWILSRGNQVLAQGRKDETELPSKKHTA